MDTQTSEALETSTEFLKDAVEVTHLFLKQQLEAMRNGEPVKWEDIAALMKEGRASARQIAQNASLQVRDRKLDLDERKLEAETKPKVPRPTKAPTHEDREKFLELSTQWMGNLAECARHPEKGMAVFPEGLTEMVIEYGLDPNDRNSLEVLSEWLYPEPVPV